MKYLLPTTIVIALLILGGYFFFRQPQIKYTVPVEKITVGTIAEYSTLVDLAQERGLFKDNGLDVTTIEHTSGAPVSSHS